MPVLLGGVVVSCPSDGIQSHGVEACDAWPYLDADVLRPSRSRKVCMTCHWFRYQAGVNCIALLACQLHQGLISQGEHLTRRCQGWTDDLRLQRGWAPEVV